jgi:hypothetical protein
LFHDPLFLFFCLQPLVRVSALVIQERGLRPS